MIRTCILLCVLLFVQGGATTLPPPGDRSRAGEALLGIRTLEGSPEGGLPYRLRMGEEATEERPHRLVVWLHPGGGSYNREVEALSAVFVEHGFALLVTTEKDFRFWSEQDANKLILVTLPAVGAIPGIDAARPILMGFSGGGQLALELWYRNTGKLGGLILDAAYPVQWMEDRRVPRPPPDDAAVRETPVLVVVGKKDPVAGVWRKVEAEWRRAGIPLTLHFVRGKGHTWLFEGPRLRLLARWLGRIAGERR